MFSPSNPAPNLRREFPLILLIGVITFLAFSPALRFGFVYDDAAQVVENSAIRSIRSVPQFFSSHVWKDAYAHAPGNYYRPAFLSWLSLNYWLFGVKPMGWHLTSILLHVLASCLVYPIVRRLGGSAPSGFLAGLIFGIHPAHIETVAWVSGSTDSLFALCVLGSFLMYLRWRDGRRAAWLAGACIAYGLGLLAKETAIVLPLLIAVHGVTEWIGVDRPAGPPWNAGSGWLAGGLSVLTLAYLGARILVLGSLRHSTADVSLGTVLLSSPKILCFYLRLLVFPFGLSEFYDLSYVQGVWSWDFFGPLLILAALGMVPLVIFRREWRWTILGLAFVLVPLLPVLDLRTFARYELAHDRYLYLSVFGFGIWVTSLLANLTKARSETFPARGVWLFASPVLAYFLVATLNQLGHWKSDLTLLTRAREIAPHNPTAANNLANIYLRQGNLAEAKQIYERVLEEWPDQWITAYNLGHVAYQEGHWDEARRNFQLAVKLNPVESDSYSQMALALYRMKRLDEAAAAMGEAIRLAPEKRGYRLALGLMLKEMGDCARAKAAFLEELRLNPGDGRAAEGVRACGGAGRNGP